MFEETSKEEMKSNPKIHQNEAMNGGWKPKKNKLCVFKNAINHKFFKRSN